MRITIDVDDDNPRLGETLRRIASAVEGEQRLAAAAAPATTEDEVTRREWSVWSWLRVPKTRGVKRVLYHLPRWDTPPLVATLRQRMQQSFAPMRPQRFRRGAPTAVTG